MSHEGIRIITQAEGERAAAGQQPLPPGAATPIKVQIAISQGTGINIQWKDGVQSHWSFPFLRDACPCATCHEEREKSGRALGEPKPAPKQTFPIYSPPPKPLGAERIGNYAIKFRWADGHESGIYSWEFLRRLPSEKGKA